MHKFANVAVERQVYKITNFTLSRNGENFRASTHDFKLSFNVSTKVVSCESTAIPFMGFSLVKSNEIKDTKGYSDKLFEMHLRREERDTRLVVIDMVDEMGQIRCVIFGDLVDIVNGFLALPRDGLLVMIIQLARVNLYKGEVGIQNLMNASKLW
ncbi:hypothetical protein SESBI_50840 [Sesbania bispinosa]|nr:hypothetical protein SESBI_50840 [Sesbania bispinosa]